MKKEKDKNVIAENIVYSYTTYCYRQTKPPRFPDYFGERELVMTVDVCFEYDIESHRYLVKITMNKDNDITTYEGSLHQVLYDLRQQGRYFILSESITRTFYNQFQPLCVEHGHNVYALDDLINIVKNSNRTMVYVTHKVDFTKHPYLSCVKNFAQNTDYLLLHGLYITTVDFDVDDVHYHYRGDIETVLSKLSKDFENNNDLLDSITSHIEISHDSNSDDINTKVHGLITKHGSMVKASNIKHGDSND